MIPGFTKILVAGGDTNLGNTDDVEIVDVKNPDFKLDNFPALPKNISSLLGGLVPLPGLGSRPLICGGLGDWDDEEGHWTLQTDCHYYDDGQWVPHLAELAVEAFNYNAVTSPFGDGGLFAVGGLSQDDERLSVVQHFKDQDWRTVTPSFPRGIYSHCSLNLDNTTVLVTGGFTTDIIYINGEFKTDATAETYSFNPSDGSKWTKGNVDTKMLHEE